MWLLYGEALEGRIAAMEGVSKGPQIWEVLPQAQRNDWDLDIVAAVLPEDVEVVTGKNCQSTRKFPM
ncbi:MAG: hypothetical protein Ct9H90mP16_18850 [Candidatus Poseidoniales archaeon]|nr:MAG: hypothetical protein Ct9H90mP16_18850 [Candidatus Poseidoniales archaeon]